MGQVRATSPARSKIARGPQIGDHLREWRRRRRMSQLDLACEANVSTRHLSFIETGRAQPSRDMILHLAERLEIPLRERNLWLVAAGYAPLFPERSLDDPTLAAARRAVDLVLTGHEPYPALAVDRHWNLVAANRTVDRLLAGIAPCLLQPPVNVLRLALHPEGLAPRTLNLAEWRAHLLARLQRQIELTADRALLALSEELARYPAPRQTGRPPMTNHGAAAVAVPLRLRVGERVLAFFSTITVFGTPLDITLSELALESFFPADAATAEILRAAAEAATPSP
jgi:transcriptional regulator with XRE-family HTH domain